MVDIAHLCYYPITAAGSVNRVVGRQIERLKDFRHVLISYDPRGRVETNKDGFVVVPGEKYAAARRLLGCVPGRIREQYCGFESVDQIVWLHRARQVLEKHKPPVIVSHDHYKIGRWLRGWVSWPCRFVLTQHGFAYSGLKEPAEAVSGFDSVVFLTERSYRYCIDYSHSVTAAVEIIPNCIDTHCFRPLAQDERLAVREHIGLAGDSVAVVTVGRQVPKKGAHILLEGWRDVKRRCPRASLLIVGPVSPPEYEARLYGLRRFAGLDADVQFLGQLGQETLSRILGACDVFAFPSLCHEGMGLALAEAYSAGLLCVASRRAEIEELFTGANILWVDWPNSPRLWAEMLTRAIVRVEEGNAESESQWRWAREKFHEGVFDERWRAFYLRQVEMGRALK